MTDEEDSDAPKEEPKPKKRSSFAKAHRWIRKRKHVLRKWKCGGCVLASPEPSEEPQEKVPDKPDQYPEVDRRPSELSRMSFEEKLRAVQDSVKRDQSLNSRGRTVGEMALRRNSSVMSASKKQNASSFKLIPVDKSLCCLKYNNPIRVLSIRLIQNPWWDRIVMALIVISTLFLAFDQPHVSSDAPMKVFLLYADYVITALFTVEMVVKIIALGLILHDDAYFRTGWNRLDGAIVIISYVNYSASGLAWVKGIRALRALRPLRMISRFPNLKIVVNSIFASMPAIFNVMAISLLFFLIFAIMGVQQFQGQFSRCQFTNPEINVQADTNPIQDKWSQYVCIDSDTCSEDYNAAYPHDGTACSDPDSDPTVCYVYPKDLDGVPTYPNELSEMQCVGHGYEWRSYEAGNCDNFGECFLMLFEVSSLEMWPTNLLIAMDAQMPVYDAATGRSYGLPPKRDNNVWFPMLWFIIFVMTCSFFVLSLFIGVVVDEYQRQSEKFTSGGITESQKRWLESVRDMLFRRPQMKLVEPESAWRKKLYVLVTDVRFDMTITACIGLNIIVMSMTYYGEPKSWTCAMNIMNMVFTWIFVMEMLLKFGGIGLKQYWASNWNKFDAVIVIASLVVFIMERVSGIPVCENENQVVAQFQDSSAPEAAFDPTIARVFRMFRIFRIIKSAKSLRQLITTLVFSLPALYNVGVLLVLVLFIFASAGMALFGNVRFGDNLNEHANFRSFQASMITLYRISTGESWNAIMHDCSIQPPYCDPNAAGGSNCGEPVAAMFYFPTLVIISMFVMVQVFVAVVLKNFEEEFDRESEENQILTADDINKFSELWVNFCENNGEEMKISRLGTLLNLLDPPMGLSDNPMFGPQLQAFIDDLHLPQSNGMIHYVDLGLALTERVFHENVGNIPEDNEFMKCLRGQLHRTFPRLRRIKQEQAEEVFTAAEYRRVITLQRFMKNRISKKPSFMKVLDDVKDNTGSKNGSPNLDKVHALLIKHSSSTSPRGGKQD